MPDRNATVTWEGTLTEGKGTLDLGSRAVSGATVTWASRMEAPEGKTSPEELLAAAEAECYVMGLAARLARAGTPPTRLVATATCTNELGQGGVKVTKMHIDVHGEVPGVDNATFQQTAQEAEQGCPVSNALRGNVDITLQASLDSA